jgi:formylglycine-generating enzyme required for sulfatase activity
MGSPTNEAGRYGDEIQHKVILTQDYYMGVFEITQKQYELVIGENPSTYFGYMKPVESISWDTIRGGDWPGTPPGTGQPATDTFIYKLRDKTGLNFDLPTEAQWEYACRATTIRAFNDYTINGGDGPDCTVPYGNSDPGLDPLGRYSFNGNYADRHVVVGSYQPNLWGLYDMHGNVWEWCLDWYASYRLDAIDPLGDKWGDGWDYTRVRRGGSWVRSAGDCRSATRLRSHTSFADDQIGFRLSIQK